MSLLRAYGLAVTNAFIAFDDYNLASFYLTAYDADLSSRMTSNFNSDRFGLAVVVDKDYIPSGAVDDSVTRNQKTLSICCNRQGDLRSHAFDQRCAIDENDLVYTKRMPSAFSKPSWPAI